MRLFKRLFFVFSLTIVGFNFHFSQTGPAGVGDNTSNVLWLKADGGTSSKVNGDPVSFWIDESGNGNTVAQGNANQQPIYLTNGINGMPVIEFDNNSTANQNDFFSAPDAPELDNTNGLTVFSVVRPQTLGSARSIIAKRNNVGADQSYMFFFFTGNRLFLDLDGNNDRFDTNPIDFPNNTNYILTFLYDGSLAAAQRCRVFSEQNLLRTATETSAAIPDYNSPLVIGATHVGDSRSFGGQMAEIIMYREALNITEKVIVDNYLSGKYNITLSSNDFYAGDLPVNDDYDFEIAGIGQTSVTDNHVAFANTVSGGLGIQYQSGFDNGDYLMVGHKFPSNAINTVDINVVAGGPLEARWERIWYFDITNTGAAINTQISFDISDGGMGDAVTAGTDSDYKLLYRSGTSGNWTIVATANAVLGDRIFFNYSFNADAEDGYYTIGTLEMIQSPLPVELTFFDANVIENSDVKLEWETASEINNNYFEIQHSKDGVNFKTIGKVIGAGNSSVTNRYHLMHKNPNEGVNYYKLYQVDFDGTKTEEGIEIVNLKMDTYFEVFPNPANDVINFISNTKEEGRVTIVDLNGKLIYQSDLIYETNKNVLNIESLENGIYFVQFYDKYNELLKSVKFIKEK